MGAVRSNRPRRRLGGLIIVVVVAVAAVALVLWVVLRDNNEELLAPPVNTTPLLGNDALLTKFDAAVAVTVPADDGFLASQSAASAACGCAAGEQDPKTFAIEAQALQAPLQEQQRLLEDMQLATSEDVAEDVQAVIDVNRQLQADVTKLHDHTDDADTGELVKARRDLLKHLAARAEAIQVVRTSLGGGAVPGQSTPSSAA